MAITEARPVADLSQLQLNIDEKQPRSGERRLVLATAVVLGAVVALVLLALAFSRSRESANEAAKAQATSPPAATTPARAVAPAASPETITAGGYVEARRTSALLPARDGVVKRVHVELGQRVEEGALLVEFKSSSLAADVSVAEAVLSVARARLRGLQSGARAEEIDSAHAEAEAAAADLEEARRERERLESLSGLVAEAEVERARARERAAAARGQSLRARERLLRRGSRESEITAAEAQVEQAQAALERTRALLEESRLRAPFGGVVVRLDLELGEGLSPLTSSRIEIADISELWVRVDVPETRIAGVVLDAAAEVVVDALGGEALPATVVQIAPLADRQSNTVEVAVRIKNAPALLRPNMSARVTITKEGSDE